MDVKIELKEDITIPEGKSVLTFKGTRIDSKNDLKEFMTAVYQEIWPKGKK